MTDISLENLTTTWVDLDTKCSLQTDGEYLIQNRGADFCLAHVATTAPQAGDVEGVLVPNLMQIHYKKGSGTLYVRAYSGTCSINVAEAN